MRRWGGSGPRAGGWACSSTTCCCSRAWTRGGRSAGTRWTCRGSAGTPWPMRARWNRRGRSSARSIPGIVLVGDEDRLRQVVGNLLANVRVHTPAGTPAEVILRRDGDAAELRVVDHGPGIDPEHGPRVFDRFYRADPGRSRERGGSGLGLSIVASVVAAHGGTALARSHARRRRDVRGVAPVHRQLTARSRRGLRGPIDALSHRPRTIAGAPYPEAPREAQQDPRRPARRAAPGGCRRGRPGHIGRSARGRPGRVVTAAAATPSPAPSAGISTGR